MNGSRLSYQSILDMPGLKGETVHELQNDNVMDFIESIANGKQGALASDTFYVLDIAMAVSLMERWNKAFPSVHPFYAMKCNPNPSLVGALAALGSHFDCASQHEIELVLSLGVSPDRIIYANTCKPESHIRYAKSVGVNLLTFDSIDEVEKIRRSHPNCGLVLRLKAPDEGKAKVKLGSKAGALPEEVKPLLEAANAAQLRVLGVSFHVGGVTTCESAYVSAIASAREVFDAAVELGMPRMNLLDIGGGFVADSGFESLAQTMNQALTTHFSNEPELKIISEPGRFFVETCFTLVASIIGKRVRGEVREYWIGDGTHGSFHEYAYDVLDPIPLAYAKSNPTCEGMRKYPSTIFGPTCDSADILVTDHQLPDLEVNDWLVFRDMGAYSSATGSNFNGFYTSEIPTYIVLSSA